MCGTWVTSAGIIAKMATQPDQLSRSIASAVSRAVERAVDQALASLPSLPGNSGFATATQEVCNIDVSGGGELSYIIPVRVYVPPNGVVILKLLI